MNAAVIHVLFVGVSLAVVAVLVALMLSRKGNHPATYKLSEPWTHEPILWAAIDEVVPGGGPHGHGSDVVSVGGGASGKW
ncbi:aa3-type cytochrome oxidase subunit CtaJ [Candidatus Mycolicibacterium alkanivorans]|uniref:aa3-type cytochrome oxidase subunit CtaJ n=1 Tax=Candidatus Mycolicibacterium alkanivorans TaxID=2954114 RepID=UPI003FD870F7